MAMMRLSEMFRTSRDGVWGVPSTFQIETLDPPVILYPGAQIPLPLVAEIDVGPELAVIPRAPEELTTAEKIARAKAALKRLLAAGNPLAAAFSGGKL